MSKVYARFYGDNGTLQIDDTHPIYSLARKGRKRWEKREYGSTVVFLYTSYNEMLFVRGEHAVILSGISTRDGITEHVYETLGEGYLDYWVYSPGGIEKRENYGFRIYGEDGRVIFDALSKPLRIVGCKMRKSIGEMTANLPGGKIAVCVTRISGEWGSDNFVHGLAYESQGDGGLKPTTTPSTHYHNGHEYPVIEKHTAIFADVTNH